MERAERHAARLCRDAVRLGLPPPDAREVENLLVESARAAFGRGDGIVRVEWSRPHTDDADPELRAVPRDVGAEPRTWRAADSRTTHPGPEERRNTKFVDVPAYDLARKEVRESDLDEVLLYDAEGLLVEGSRSNFVVATDSGRLLTPEPTLGAVEGLGLAILRESRPRIGVARLTRSEVAAARELLAVNAVRGVIPIVELNAQPVADGQPGPWAMRLRSLFHPD